MTRWTLTLVFSALVACSSNNDGGTAPDAAATDAAPDSAADAAVVADASTDAADSSVDAAVLDAPADAPTEDAPADVATADAAPSGSGCAVLPASATRQGPGCAGTPGTFKEITFDKVAGTYDESCDAAPYANQADFDANEGTSGAASVTITSHEDYVVAATCASGSIDYTASGSPKTTIVFLWVRVP